MVAVEIETARLQTQRIALGLGQHFLWTQGQFLGLNNARAGIEVGSETAISPQPHD